MYAVRKSTRSRAAISLTLLAGLCLSSLGPLCNSAAGQTASTAYISGHGCQMRCGPGAQYYVTGTLPAGAEVRVYRRAPGGWLGIRPPEASFCWVPNDDLQVAENDERTAKVVRDGVVPWIAAAAGRAPDRWQVRLQIGETVRLLGPPERLALNGQPARWWRRIAAPAGEFRWIQQSALSEPPGRIVVKSDKMAAEGETLAVQSVSHSREPNEPTSDQLAGKSNSVEPNMFDFEVGNSRALADEPRSKSAEQEADDSATVSDEAGDQEKRPSSRISLERMERAADRLEAAFAQLDELVQPAQYGTWRRRGGDDRKDGSGKTPTDEKPRSVRFRDRKRTRLGSSDDQSHLASAIRDSSSAEPKLLGSPLPEDEFHTELVQLDADLSLMVAKPLRYWKLADLQRRAVELSQRGPTALDRGRAALLLDSIHGFDQLMVRRLAADDDDKEDRKFARASESRERTTDEPKAGETLDDDKDPMRFRVPTGSGLQRPAQLGGPEKDKQGEAIRRDRTASENSPYDAQGVLKRVTSTTRVAPPYALVNEHGNIITLVAPAPGLNLQTYLGKNIGLFGPQRRLPSFRSGLLTAQRVVRMDRIR